MKMKKDNVKVGQTYAAKVSGNVVPVRLDKVNVRGGWDGLNLRSGKPVRIRSSQRLRGLWPKRTMPIIAEKADDKGVAETVAAVEKGNLAEGVTVPEAKKSREAARDATGESGRDTGERDATGGKQVRNSLLNLAAKVLFEAGEPMTCKEMVEKVLATGLWQTKGRTPSSTLYSAVLRECQSKGAAARFRKVGKGKFAAASK